MELLNPIISTFFMIKPKSEKELMLELIKTKYGERLDGDQLDAVERSLEKLVAVIEEIRNVPLENGDEPFNVFKPYRRNLT